MDRRGMMMETMSMMRHMVMSEDEEENSYREVPLTILEPNA
jgi:hypothetical protein